MLRVKEIMSLYVQLFRSRFLCHLGFVELPRVHSHAMCEWVRDTSLFRKIGQLYWLILQ